MPELRLSSLHDARDAEDERRLGCGEYAKLVESYYGVIVKRCQARTRSDAEAFDVAAEVVVRLLRELKAGKHYTVPFRVAVHGVIGWKLTEHFAARSKESELSDAPVVESGYAAVEDRTDLKALLGELPAREREVALLRVLVGLTPSEIAAKLGISRNNVDQAWHRAKTKLRETLEAP